MINIFREVRQISETLEKLQDDMWRDKYPHGKVVVDSMFFGSEVVIYQHTRLKGCLLLDELSPSEALKGYKIKKHDDVTYVVLQIYSTLETAYSIKEVLYAVKDNVSIRIHYPFGLEQPDIEVKL
jgi:hypothetical protein